MTINLKKLILPTMMMSSFFSGLTHAAAEDDPVLWKVMIDQLEYRDASGDNPVVWESQAWLGQDRNKLWFKTEGERVNGFTENAEAQLLYSKAVSPYWDFQAGVRQDFEPSPERSWAAIGFQGLAPYFFEIDTALFIGGSGRTALRLEAEYELMLTQRLILSPEIEINLHGKNDEATGTGSGLSNMELGLRLRYEIRRGSGPYIGINRENKYGNTADYARDEGEDTGDTQFVVGFRATF
jgi:copper resistance protein B